MVFDSHFNGRAAWRAPSKRTLKCTLAARLVFATVVWLIATVATADIDVKPQYEVGEPIIVKVAPDNMPDGAVVRGGVFECDGAAFEQVNPTTFHVWAKPGKYTVEVFGKWRLTKKITDKDGTEWDVLIDDDMYRFRKSFQVGPEVPDPVPPPDPPTPGGPHQILMLHDADQLDNLPPSQRSLLTSLAYRQKLIAAGHSVLGVFAIQSLQPGVAYKHAAFFDAAKGQPMPQIVIAKEGGPAKAYPLPTDEDAMGKLLEVSP